MDQPRLVEVGDILAGLAWEYRVEQVTDTAVRTYSRGTGQPFVLTPEGWWPAKTIHGEIVRMPWE